MKFKSPNGKEYSKKEVFDIVVDTLKDADSDFHLWIGTDSQNFHKTKMVLVVCLYEQGKGGRFFYYIEWMKKIRVLDTKIYTETEMSLSLARELNEYLHNHGVRAKVEIHCDIGPNGKTKDLIAPIVGWVKAEGFVPKIKYDSVVASTIADHLSK